MFYSLIKRIDNLLKGAGVVITLARAAVQRTAQRESPQPSFSSAVNRVISDALNADFEHSSDHINLILIYINNVRRVSAVC